MKAKVLSTSCLIGLASALAAPAVAQEVDISPISSQMAAVSIDSGFVANTGKELELIWSSDVVVPEARWLRLHFDVAMLAGDVSDNTESYLQIRSHKDDAVQLLNPVTVGQWRNTSAYFNGNGVTIELWARPGSGNNRIAISQVVAGAGGGFSGRSICGATDDRVLSSDPRAGRLLPVGCTGWLIDDCNHCMITAGHCEAFGFDTVQFNVPLSNPDQSLNHPPPEDQYVPDPASMQSNGGLGVGDDWAYYGCFPNSNTGLTPGEAQGAWYTLAPAAPVPSGQDIRITGYGSTSSPVPNEWYLAQKTHTGPYFDGGVDTHVEYQTDTTGGNSGSAVVDESTGMAIGVHTHAGCSASSGNNGTAIHHPGFQAALNNPLGVCCRGLSVSPGSGVISYGVVGGPFTNASVVYTLDNQSGNSVDYTVDLDAGGDGFYTIDGGTSQLSGTIGAGSSTTVTVALDGTAPGASAGIYNQDIVFTDVSNSATHTRSHTLEIGQTLVNVVGDDVFDSGPTGGPFNDSEIYTITSKRPTPVNVEVSVDVGWLDVNGGAGPYTAVLSGDGDFEDVTVAINASANSLPAGLAQGTITFTNLADGSTETRDATIDVGRFVYPSTDTPIAINDNTEFDSILNVSDSFCIGDVDVDIDISHTFIGDLIVTLISPEGTQVVLHNRSGGSADDLMLRYDDKGTVPDGPGLLADFDGEAAGGNWILRVSDNAGADQGTLNSWSLRIASAGAVCPPVAHDGGLQVDENFIGDATLDYTTRTGNPTDVIVTVLPLNGNLWTQSDVCIDSVPFTLPNNEQIVQYKPVIGFTGTDSFKFMVDDGLPSNIATMTVNVGGAVGLVDEDFEGGIPGTWQIVDLQPGGSFDTWNTNTYYNNANYTNGSGLAACVDTDEWGSGTGDYDLALITPAVGLDSSSELTYTTNYQNVAAQDFADVDISTDAGANWTNLLSWNEDHGGFYATPGEDITIDLSSYAGQQGLIRFRYYSGTTGGWDWYWEIDDVMISGTAPSTHPADFNRNGILNSSDFVAYLNAYNADDPRADHNTNCIINTADFLAFLNDYNS